MENRAPVLLHSSFSFFFYLLGSGRWKTEHLFSSIPFGGPVQDCPHSLLPIKSGGPVQDCPFTTNSSSSLTTPTPFFHLVGLSRKHGKMQVAGLDMMNNQKQQPVVPGGWAKAKVPNKLG
ncbi:hypothetical protein OPV22_001140 [Ensete ventricosum]|uniref:Uncharacterized protein n=1 Tax=Ensete ventricosum TaxID=4639 RepID=A0AAV8QI10_ENSVE|nr:hypothetical protein OPV22_001140 [Ensete ventricosum]